MRGARSPLDRNTFHLLTNTSQLPIGMLRLALRAFVVLFAALLAGLLGVGQDGIRPATAQVMLPTLTSYLRVDFAADWKGGRPRLTGYV